MTTCMKAAFLFFSCPVLHLVFKYCHVRFTKAKQKEVTKSRRLPTKKFQIDLELKKNESIWIVPHRRCMYSYPPLKFPSTVLYGKSSYKVPLIFLNDCLFNSTSIGNQTFTEQEASVAIFIELQFQVVRVISSTAPFQLQTIPIRERMLAIQPCWH